ncbi:MAG TPA: hypothetical protein VFE10_05485, partial [Phenylobacterium sp.]|nr:hypothetical protein [Phenylobacterium sp.]
SLEGALQELTSKAPRDGDYYIRFLGEKLSYEALLLKQASIDGASKAMTRHSKLLGGLLQQAETELQKRGTSYETCELLNKGAYYLNELDIAEVHFADFPKRFSSYPEIILRTYVAFVRQVKELYSEDWRMWPDGFVDTFAWVGLHLYLRAGRSSEFTHVTPEKILQIYEQIRKREFVSEADLLEFRRHGSEAERLLAAD